MLTSHQTSLERGASHPKLLRRVPPPRSLPSAPPLTLCASYRTIPLLLGECDAFISHSWSDCAATKWLKLQRWRYDFIERHHREPIVWIDKVCIDQTDIDANLMCLPLHLAGSQKLLIIVG